MFSDQVIFCVPFVIELDVLFPGLHAMTFSAVFFRPGSLKPVNIVFLVARDTGRLQTEIVRVGRSQDIWKLRPLRTLFLVALKTLDLAVLAFKNITGFRVIKGVGIDLGAVVIPSVVIGVALYTSLPRKPMESTLCCDLYFDLLVTLVALLIRNAFSGLVTFEAIRLLVLCMPEHQGSGSE